MAGGPVIDMKAAPVRKRRWPRRVAKVLTLGYWWPALAVDCWSLLRFGFSELSAQRTLRLMVIQSLVYLLIWGICAAVASLAGAGPDERQQRRPATDRPLQSLPGSSRDHRGR